MIKNIKKRNGDIVAYESKKIQNAIEKALKATHEGRGNNFQAAAIEVTSLAEAILEKQFANNTPTVEEIQNIVEKSLMLCGFHETARAYILYRKQHEKVRETKRTMVDATKLMSGFLGDVKDWRTKESSTVTTTLGGLILYLSGSVTANFWLNEIYDEDVRRAHTSALIHLHDLSMLSGYCAGWSLKQLIQTGIKGVEGRIASAPAKHLHTLSNQMVNFLGIMQNEWAGAQAFSSFDTLLAPYVKADNLSYKEVKQCIQSFVYGVNTPSRWGTQAPFSNITLDWVVPKDMELLPAIVGGKMMPFTYGECKPEMDMVNKAFLEIMIEGDADGRGFQYPIPTYSITKDFDWSENENNKLLFEMAAKYGTPYFSNYINSDMDPSDVRSMCCRLRLELNELRKKGGGYFGSGDSTGSIGVVTLNLPRLAYLAADEQDFYAQLEKTMDIAARSLDTKRKVITALMEQGLYPYTKAYLGSFDNHFSTIGLVGMNEAAMNAKWLRTNLTTDAGQEFAKKTLDFMREKLKDYQTQYGALFNLEATPAESTSFRFAKHDVEKYPEIITAAEEGQTPFYTNSSHLPVGHTDDIFDALDLQDDLQTRYTSGTVFHGFLGERLPDWRAAANLVKKVAENYRLPYFTLSPVYSICPEHGYLAGEHETCPHCGKEAEVYSRITGYYRPVKNWNDGKVQEYKQRKAYAQEKNTAERVMKNHSEVVVQTVETAPVQAAPAGETILVTTATCPNCTQAKSLLDAAGIQYQTVLANENRELIRKYRITAAPTLIKDGETFAGLDQIVAHLS